MKRAINMLGWFGVAFTTLSVILTLLTTYQFIYVKHFETYATLEWSMFFTMAAWSLKFIEVKNGVKNKFCPIVCSLIAFGTIFFIYMKVY